VTDAELTCESCGSAESVLWAVHRIYITPAEHGFEDLTEARQRMMPEVEHWCVACCASYPHQQVGPADS
jgi:hypothetical protein